MIVAAPAQYLTLTATSGLHVTGLRGEAAPVVTGGFGGWDKTARPRRKALTEWSGIDPIALTFDLIFDGFEEDLSIEGDCLTLERMAHPPAGGGEPPIVTVTGVIPYQDVDWVIEDLTPDTSPIYSTSGWRARQAYSVQLLEYVADDRTTETAAARARQKPPSTATAPSAPDTGADSSRITRRLPPLSKLYIVKAGDTLQRIAAAKLGDYKRWHAIADLNGIRDPKNLVVGEALRLP